MSPRTETVDDVAERLLSRLEKVKQTGPDRYLALCPGHDDRHPSLSVRVIEDRLLIHCWSGCSAYEIVRGAGLELSDLFPRRNPDPAFRPRPVRRPFPAADILRALSLEITFIAVVAADLAEGKLLEPDDRDRLMLAADRCWTAIYEGGLYA